MPASVSRVLILFGGDEGDQALATDFAGMNRKFRSDPQNLVTAISTIHLDNIDALKNGPLVLCEGGPSGPRYVVWERGDDPFFEVHQEGFMKAAVLDWLQTHIANARVGDKITLVICCHGRDEEVLFGIRDNLNETFTADELLSYLNLMPRGTAFNLINVACSSGSWVVKIRQHAQLAGNDLKITTHAASAPSQLAWQFRSVSGEDRCGVFSPAVIKSFQDGGNMFVHHRRVENRCKQYKPSSQAMMEVSLPSVWAEETHTVYTATIWTPLPQLNSLWHSVASFASTVATFLSPRRRAPGYGAVKAAVERLPAVSYRENGVYSLGRRYLSANLRAVEKRVLEDLMTQRRASQLQVFFFLKEAISRGLFSEDLFHIPSDWNDSPMGHFSLLDKCFPNVRTSMRTVTEPQLSVSYFDAPLEWLALCIAAGTELHYRSYGGPLATASQLLSVGESIGWDCASESMVADLALRPMEMEESDDPVTFKIAEEDASGKKDFRGPYIFDFILPTTKEEWKEFDSKWMDYQRALLL